MSVKGLSLKEARDKLGAKQAALGEVFEQAIVIGDSGEKQYDFNRVTCLGDNVKGSNAVAEKVKAMNAELNELSEHAEVLEAAEKAAGDYANRDKARRNFVPGGNGAPGVKGGQSGEVKSIGEMVAEEKAYKQFLANGAAGGVSMSFDDYLASDFLAGASQFETIGAKALMSTAAGWAPQSIRLPGFTEAVTRPIQLLDILPMFKTGESSVKYMEETLRNHAAAEAAEGGAYAESAFGFTERESPVRKITDSVPVTDEQLEDVPMMAGYINGRLGFGLRQRFDRQCLIGDGLGSNMRGLKNTVGIQVQAKGADPIPDAFFKAMTKIRVVGRAIATHHVMHPTDWEKVRLLRTVDGVYIWGNPSEAGPERLWGLPVVQNDADAAGNGYVGSFMPAFVSLYERKGVDIQLGYVGSQFLEGKRTVRADTRAALVFSRPTAFCQVTGLAA